MEQVLGWIVEIAFAAVGLGALAWIAHRYDPDSDRERDREDSMSTRRSKW